jgi:hypothetical protein
MAPKELLAARGAAAKATELREMSCDGSDDEDEGDMDSSKANSSSGGLSGSSHPSNTDWKANRMGDNVSVDACSVTKARTKQVNQSKTLVYLSLLAAAVVVGTLSYIFAKKQERYSFHVAVRMNACMYGTWNSLNCRLLTNDLLLLSTVFSVR